MNNSGAAKALAIVVAVLAAVLTIGVLTFAGGCVHDDGTVSTCHTAQVAIAIAAAIGVVLSVVSLFVPSRKAAGAILLVVAACGVFAVLAPGTVFPLCMMATMRCHTIMQPFAQFFGVALAAVALIAGIRGLRGRA